MGPRLQAMLGFLRTLTLSPDGVRTTADLAQALLDERRVALTTGEAFDAPGFIRISYATSLDILQRGCERIIEYVRTLAGAGVRG